MKIKNQILTFLSLLVLTACDSKDVEPNPLFSEVNIEKLAIGKTSDFWVKAFDESGKQSGERRYSRTIVRDTLIAGQKWYINDDDSPFISNQTNGLHYFYQLNSKPSLVYKYPTQKGDVFDSFVFVYTPETGEKFESITGVKKVEVVSTNVTVVSPLSGVKYENCIHYRTAKFTPTTSEGLRIYPNEQYVIPGKGAVLYFDYYEEDRKNIVSIREKLN